MECKKILLFALISVFLIGCDKDKDKNTFDRKAMLDNMASAVIQPALQSTNASLSDLNAAASAFTTNPNASTIADLQSQFVSSYKSFQRCKMFDFGPMMNAAVKASMNTYPTDVAQIESNIGAGTYDVNAATNTDAIGFPALDYLLYSASNSVLLDSFSTGVNATTRCSYLTDITGKMASDFTTVVNNWSSYQSTFINADGNDVGGSTSLVFNEFLKDIELLKNAKIGIPSGQQTGGQTLPTYVEGYYSQISIQLAKENVDALKGVFLGGSGSGFDDYIRDVESEETTTSLADNISSQFDVITAKLNAIGSPLSDKVDSNPTAVNETYLEIKKLVTYCKTDMSSVLGLLITFQDNDGD